ncbi:pyridoxamine 5'-phosphate oxidase family protein [Lentzea sp. BCCO 10_0061]|uniref:Pyridoxamine 5'-phosphate oxidase family protein n=1 Tax=Lentzea sokolovensis TaxID=3095429 RepID=A0ABU4VF87_9PSEU|nr:pyridoxamine 5'-phosphate oxidase family protein [Lentzea sp. BCCO 10_0061]MDX8149540.1 pyridoxamine 5'-phosphate oxidase family protein [Lentzea sp. BCCO 10_0061]
MTSTEEHSAIEALLHRTLAAHKSMFLATAGSDGSWVSGVYFAEDGLHTLVLVLEERGRTLKAIKENPEVALVVSTGSPMEPFLQARGTAVVVDGAEDEAVRQRLVTKVPEVEPFLATPIRAVKVSVPSWRVTDIPNGWLPGKDFSA